MAAGSALIEAPDAVGEDFTVGATDEIMILDLARTILTLTGREPTKSLLALSVASKPSASDLRGSAALDIIHLLKEKGARVSYRHPYIANFRHNEHIDWGAATGHAGYDWDLVRKHTQDTVDARNALLK